LQDTWGLLAATVAAASNPELRRREKRMKGNGQIGDFLRTVGKRSWRVEAQCRLLSDLN
jgi:hypothetical protein